MSKITLCNEDCLNTMQRIAKHSPNSVDMVLTSPPYNITRQVVGRGGVRDRGYDVYVDQRTPSDYIEWCCEIFKMFDRLLVSNGVVLWNVSYGSDSSQGIECSSTVWTCLAEIIKQTDFMVADKIAWKKSSAYLNNVSPNKLTRIVEDIFVFCRKDEYKTYYRNNEISSIRDNGQVMYKPIFNFVEAKNNDGACNLNKATFSTELCRWLLGVYAKPNAVVYDPFMGTGTTSVACCQLGLNCIGSEISEKQVRYSLDRLGVLDKDIVQESDGIYSFSDVHCNLCRHHRMDSVVSNGLFDIV